jgi:NAD(P)H-flavin reductase
MEKTLTYQGNKYVLKAGETLLDGLLRHGKPIAYSCKSGTCQSCLMQAVKGDIPEKAQLGLKPAFKQRKLFLACQCYPLGDMQLADPDAAGIDIRAHIIQKSWLNSDILALHLQPEDGFEGEPGQYLTMINPHGVARSYSIANNPQQDGFIALHIRLISGGKMSEWLKNEADINSSVTLRGSAGNCFYVATENNDYPIMLAATGTGLAPLYGIINAALGAGHRGAISLFHGARKTDDLYLTKELKNLAQTYQNFTYTPCISEGKITADFQGKTGDIKEIVMASLPPEKANIHLFLCGAPQMVNGLKTQAFLSGLASKNIYADPFLPSKN